ncbi:hypothetical protein [Streptomyces sp. NPDC007905]|uniref:hypothetical protein n=1 Tax=Streptomyces sp. NPDC007905 TaxID=3364788 RepID=UPI0036E33597
MALEDQHPQGRHSRPPDLAPLAGDELLPCGRPLSHAWEQARDTAPGPDPHTAACPHCREAAEGLTALDEATLALRAQEPAGVGALANRVMDIVRSEVRLGHTLPLDDPALDLRISEHAAAKVLRQAADTVPGTKAASCRLAPAQDGTSVHVAMTVAVALDQPLPIRAQEVRRSVIDVADRGLGLALTEVDLTVVDLLPPERGGAR